jgi:hypothetical protein
MKSSKTPKQLREMYVQKDERASLFRKFVKRLSFERQFWVSLAVPFAFGLPLGP